jgi:hypothetical protein
MKEQVDVFRVAAPTNTLSCMNADECGTQHLLMPELSQNA